MCPSPEPFGDDELDRLLAQARWPEPSADQAARLAAHWRQHQRRHRQAVYGTLALAAGLLVLAGVAIWRQMPVPQIAAEPHHESVVPQQPQPSLAAQEPSPPPVAHARHESPPPASDGDRVRDPSLYEQVALLGAFPRSTPQHRTARRPRSPNASLHGLIAVADARSPVTIADGFARLRVDGARYERLLWAAVRDGEGRQRVQAVQLLARLGTSRSLPILTELLGDAATHATAVYGLGRLGSDRDVARLAAAESNPMLRRELLHVLLARRTDESMDLFLDLVHEPRTRADALAAVAQMDNPPADLLLGYLESPQGTLRLAAARALARLPDPTIAERLCQSLGGIGRQEALMALLLSHSDQAADCLDHARHSVYLVAAVQAAELQLQSLDSRGGNLP